MNSQSYLFFNNSMKLVLLIVLALFFIETNAQQVVNTSSKTAIINNIEYDWQVGEPIIETKSNGTLLVTQGFLQPTYLLPTNMNTIQFAENQIKIYPNPTSGFLQIETNIPLDGVVQYQLFAVDGGVLWTSLAKNPTQRINKIDLSSFANGNYFLKINYISDNGIQQGTYKIQKINY